ncbi:nucleotidyltransferase family protein [Maridesulfovibrio zosterae]|uniref:nucleotidyltransferase family protein n=1 Tax=Maridesulfovibrio zosterae TaxID=82171 RepID=UPI00041470A8|nr:nucleotidyltransferase family protein [Maridesulfovibrio zosterae]
MTEFNDIPVIILAGGKGTRLSSVVADRPKPLAEVLGRPYITFLLDQLVESGSSRVVISTGYKAQMIKKALGSKYRSLRLSYAQEDEPLGTGGGIRLAMEQLEGDIFLVLNGDSYCGADLSLYSKWFFKELREASLLLTRMNDTSRYGRVYLDDSQQVTNFVEKGGNTGSGLINAGIYLLKRSVLSDVPVGYACSIEQNIFPGLIGKGLFGFPVNASFLDIGTPESYAEAKLFFKGIQETK